jgi:hypothetical protein
VLHESLIPTTTTPIRVNISPIITALWMDSFIVNGESKATHKGTVLTRTTELATVVYCSELIHVAKCNAKNIPDSNARSNSPREREVKSRLRVETATGTRIKEAMVNLQAAITRDVTSFCAKRIKIDAVDTATIPMMMATKGGTGARLGESIYKE